jgi:hypothetical protein
VAKKMNSQKSKILLKHFRSVVFFGRKFKARKGSLYLLNYFSKKEFVNLREIMVKDAIKVL